MGLVMGKRITIMLDDDLYRKLLERQVKLIKESIKSVSFSRVVNETLRKSIK
jgi:predicted CopG family antitoxin